MTTGLSRRLLLAFAAFWAAGAARGQAQALTVARLQRLLQGAVKSSIPFEEVRESPWLAAPVTSRGTLHATPQALEKRVVSPREEVWRLLPDRIEWAGPGGAGRKQITFTQAPALAALAGVMRNVIGGDLAALEREFRVQLQGDENAWRVLLVPRNTAVSMHLDSVELQGAGGRLKAIVVAEPQGVRTTTRLFE